MIKKRLKILFVIPYFAPAWGYGGPVKLSMDIGKNLVKRGHKVTVYASDTLDGKNRIRIKSANLEGMNVHYLPNLSNLMAWKKIFFPLSLGSMLKKHLPEFDVIHCFDFRTYQNIQVNHYADVYKKPYILSVLGQTQKATGIRLPIKIVYDRFWGRKVVKGAKYLIAQNENERKDLTNFGAKESQVKLVPLLLDLTEFRTLPKKGEFRRKYNLGDKKVILFLGRLHIFKGVQLLVDALKRINDSNIVLVIVGRDDGYEKDLRIKIKELGLEKRIIFTGPLYGDKRLPAYADADIFTFTPIHFEETSLACLEAMACGKPIIVTHQASIPNFGKYRAGFEVGADCNIIADKIKYLVSDNKIIIAMGNQAKKMVFENFSQDKVMDSLEMIYKNSL